MLHFFRSMIKSKVGAGVAIGLLGLIALAFASGDVASSGGFGGVAGGDRVATVGEERIDTATLSQATTSALERIKQRDPTISMKAFLANDGMEDVLASLIDRLAIAAFGRKNGIVASERLIDSEIATMPVFKGADGRFSDDLFRQMIQQRGISEQLLRDDLSQSLIARQIMMPATTGLSLPAKLARRYASLLTETRKSEIAVLPTLLFAQKDKPTEKQVAAYYKANRNDFIRPERRVIRYATFGTSIFKDVPKPTEAEIAYRYNANKEQYEASEKRRIVQLILPTEAAAKAVAAEVSRGKSLENAAISKGLSAAKLELLSQGELARQFSEAFAQSVFAAPEKTLISPSRSALGWHIARVEQIDSQPERTLTQASAEISAAIAQEKHRAAITDTLERIEDSFDDGSSFTDEAEQLGLEAKQTPALTADGRVYLKPGIQIPEELKAVLQTAFRMEMEEPQLAEVERGKTFLIYDVTEIAPSTPAPLKDIRDTVQALILQEKASAQAKEAAREIQAQIADGKSMKQALRSLKRSLPPIQNVKMTRPELARMQQQQRQVPRPIALMFNMAEGTTKVQSAPNDQAWFVVSLLDIEPGKISDDDKIVDRARREIGALTGREYSDALGRAILNQLGVERNEDGIRAVRKQLGGES
ncbi:MAG: SurA N-terminal domain-containing protein [Sphingomonadaceae bacterium]|nr:SurA N-terminal domain-containing protein [Sphingomonadaceae bacterium]